MAGKRKPVKVSAGEMSILQMLWDEGPCTLSAAHQAMGQRGSDASYTTVQTQLNRLVDKLAVKKSATRPAQYQAALSQGEVSGPLLDMLVQKVSGAAPLVAHLLQDPSISREELDEMKQLIADAEARLSREEKKQKAPRRGGSAQ